MDTSNNPGAQLLIKYIKRNITSEELTLLYKYMEESPVLKEKFKELSDPDNLWDRFWDQHDIDIKDAWEQFESKYLVDQAQEPPVRKKRLRFIYSAAALIGVLIVGAFIYIYIQNIKKPIVSEIQPDPRLMTDTAQGQDTTNGYMDLAGKGRFNLDNIPEEGISYAGLSILNQGSLFTITNNNNNDDKTPRSIYKLVTADKQVKLQLPDSSRITLNKKSTIIFPLPFDLRKRVVGFSGEAYFEVKSNPNAPFIVQLNNNAIVNAHGTAFNINCYGKNCYTTLFRGFVTVTKAGQERTLVAGEQLRILETPPIFNVTKIDTTKVAAWTKKEFEYKNIGFEEMMVEVGRWYGFGVRFLGNMPQRKCKVFLNEDVVLDDLLNSIKQIYGVEIKKNTAEKRLDVTAKEESDGNNNSGFKFQVAPFKP